jgi:cytochrome P450
MIRAAKDHDPESQTPHAPILSREEIVGNSFIFFFAGHETTGNHIHFSLTYLAMDLAVQKRMQADIDRIVGSKPISDFSYKEDMPRLFNSMVGAVSSEQLRLIPAILMVPKIANGDQVVTLDGREIVVPGDTSVQLSIVGVNRNPRYWHHSPSKITPGTHDVDDFVPDRWLHKTSAPETHEKGDDIPDGLESTSFEKSGLGSLFRPVKGSYIPFSEGARSCPGRRFAQVEVTAVLTTIFQKYTLELDVGDWATDEEVVRMDSEEKKAVYGKAIERVRIILKRCEQSAITLQMKKGDRYPVRFVERGMERFAGLYGSED